uniref:Pentatricopeptide repeat-containing protein n=1 Tax=Quercus lobata TaxID=97700 RepID=A0A7N2LQZ5_QUELO
MKSVTPLSCHFSTARQLQNLVSSTPKPEFTQRSTALTEEMCGEILDQYPDIKILKKLHSKIIVDQPLYSNPSLGMKLIRAYAARGEPIIKVGLDLNFFMGNGLVAMDGKCGCLMEVWLVIDEMLSRDVVFWNSRLLDAGTIASLLPAVTNVSSNNVSYVKEIFMKLAKKSVVSWNVIIAVMKFHDVVSRTSMISAFGLNGLGHDAVVLFVKMRDLVLSPDSIAFVSVISGCSHAGLLEKRQYYLKLMTEEYWIIPRIEHYAYGLPVVGFTHMEDWGDLCPELLGHRPSGKDVGINENMAVLCGARLRASWLESWFSNPFSANATDLIVQWYTWFYILEMLGGMLFMDKSSERLSIMYLQFFNPISNGKKYS